MPEQAIKKVYGGNTARGLTAMRNWTGTIKGDHPVLGRRSQEDGRPNKRMVHNYAKYIVVMTVGYLLGDKIKYGSEKDLSQLMERYKRAGMFDADEEIAKDMSVSAEAMSCCICGGRRNPYPKVMSLIPKHLWALR